LKEDPGTTKKKKKYDDLPNPLHPKFTRGGKEPLKGAGAKRSHMHETRSYRRVNQKKMSV